MCMRLCVCVCVWLSVCVKVCDCLYVYVCVNECVCVWRVWMPKCHTWRIITSFTHHTATHTHTHTHTHKHTQKYWYAYVDLWQFRLVLTVPIAAVIVQPSDYLLTELLFILGKGGETERERERRGGGKGREWGEEGEEKGGDKIWNLNSKSDKTLFAYWKSH